MKRHFTRLMQFSVAVCAAVILAGCSVSPERMLKNGYDSSSAAVRGTTVLVQRDAISVTEAKRVEAISIAGKQSLDENAEKLRQCRALEKVDPKVKCTSAVAGISFASSILMQAEHYIDALGK